MPLDFDIITGLNISNSSLLAEDTRNRLEKMFGDTTPKGQMNVIMPVAPAISPGSPSINIGQEKLSDTAIGTWLAGLSKKDTDFKSGAGREQIVPTTGTERYLKEDFGYNPSRDNEDFYAQRQHWYSEIPKAVFLKFPALVISKTGTGIGYLAGLMNPKAWENNFIANASDNAITRVFEGLEDNIKNDWLTTFQEAADRDKGFFSRAFTDLNFWTDDVADGTAFLVSAFVPGLALSKIGVGARIASGLSRLGFAAENGVLGNLGLTKVASYMKNAKVIGDTIDKTLITALNTASESMWEAKGVKDTVTSTLLTKVNPDTGRNYTVEEAKSIAAVAARNTFLANVAALSVSNLWETNLLYKALGKNGQSAALRLAENKLGSPYQLASTAGRWNNFWSSTAGAMTKGALKGTAVEGFYEENIQLAIQRFYEGRATKDNILSQFFSQTIDAISGNDTETSMNIGLGALMGLAGGAYAERKDHRRDEKSRQGLLDALNQTQGRWLSFGNILLQNPDGTPKLTSDNKPQLDTGKIAAIVSNWQEMADLKNLSDNTDNETLLQTVKDEQLSRWVKAHINAGISQQISDKLDSISKMKDEDLIQLGFDPLSNPDKFSEVARLKEYSKKLIDLHETIERDIPAKIGKESAEEFRSRVDQLYQLGSRQLSLQNQSEELQQTLAKLKTGINNSVDDNTVDELNYLQNRIKSQEKLLENIDNYELDGAQINRIEEEHELEKLKKGKEIFEHQNKDIINTLKRDGDKYVYTDENKNRILLNQAYQKKIAEKAGLDNAAVSINREFYKIADLRNGYDYFQNKNKLLEQQVINNQASITSPADPNNVIATNNLQETPTGKSISVKMKNNTPGGEDINVELEEGRIYLGPLSKSIIGLKLGLTATLFQNDNVKVIRINPDNSVVLTINNDAPVTFSEEELSEFPALKKYADLSALQKFYIQHRNKLIKYRIPVKLNKQTGKWETKVVNARLSYNKVEDILEIVYDKNKRIPFDKKYVVGDFIDLRSLSEDVVQGLNDQQKKLEKLREIQIRLFENLINDTEKEISLEKQRAVDNRQQIDKITENISELQSKLDNAIRELSISDKSKISDNRTKAARLNKLITSLNDKISKSELLLQSLQEEKKGIYKRQAALEYMQDQYYSIYGEILTSDEPATRAELTELENRQAELRKQEGNTSRLTTAYIEGLLEDTLKELEIVNEKIIRVTDYIDILKDTLKKFSDEVAILQAFINYPTQTALRSYLHSQIAKTTSPGERSILQKIASRLNKSPENFENARFLLEELQNAQKDLLSQQNTFQALKEKAARLTDSFNTRSELNDTVERIAALKDVFAGLAIAFAKEKASVGYSEANKGGKTLAKAKTLEDAIAIKEQAQLFSEFIVEPPSDMLEEEDIIFGDSYRPVMTTDNNPLFKSADSHYPNDTLNPQSYTRRFFKFTSVLKLDGTHHIMPITAINDNQFGTPIRYTADERTYPDDIKFVVVKKMQDGSFRPVDMEGNVLSEPHSNNIVYSSIFGHSNLLSGDKVQAITWARKNFAVKEDVTDDQVWEKIRHFISFREGIKNQIKEKGNIYIPITSKSNGIQNREPFDKNNRPQQLPVEGRITTQDPDWKAVDLVVSTTAGEIPGSTFVRIKPGRLAIRRNGSVLQVYNRQLADFEKERITRLILRLTDLLGKKREYEQAKAAGKIDSTLQQQYATQINHQNLITQYLSSILYWHQPKDGITAHNNQFYINKGYLYKGNQAILFNKEELESKLPGLLDGVYHQVANILLTQQYRDKAYHELDIDKSGKLKVLSTWNSYKEYLLSSKGRNDSDIPVYTNIVPDEPGNENIPQLKNVYLAFSPGSENNVITSATTGSEQKQEPFLAINERLPQMLTAGKYILNFHNSKGTISIDAHLTYDRKKLIVNKLEPIKGQSQDPNGLIGTFIDFFNEYNNRVFEDPQTGKDRTGYEMLQKYLASGTKLQLSKESIASMSGKEEKPETSSTLSPSPVVTTPSTQTSPIVDSDMPTVDDILDNIQDDSQENYRMPLLIGDQNTYLKEDVDQVKVWFKANLPQVPVHFVADLIDNKAWGAFKRGAVYIYEGAETGTAFHEGFEAVWNAILPLKQKNQMLKEFRERNNYKQLLKDVSLTYPELSEDQLIKEQLAEEFRNYVLSSNKDESKIKGQGKRNGFFRQLWDLIKNILGLSREDEVTIDKLFRKINQAGFAEAPINRGNNISVTYRKVPGISQENTSYAIEGITSLFFQKLLMKNKNMESLFQRSSNAKLINELWKETYDQISSQWNSEMMIAAAYQASYIKKEEAINLAVAKAKLLTLNEDQKNDINERLKQYANDNIRSYRDKLTILKHFNTSVFAIFSDYLKQYGFNLKKNEVSELDTISTTEVEEKETNIKDPLGLRDSLTIDTRNTAATTVRLLIGSLTQDEYKSNADTQYKKNPLGLPKLVDYDKTLSLLFNELHSISSTYKQGQFRNTIDLMFEKLDNKYAVGGFYKSEFVWIDKLKRRLRYIDRNGIHIPLASLSKEDIKLRIAFIKSFSKNKNLPLKTIIGEGQIYQLDPISTTNYFRIRERWANNGKALLTSTSEFLRLSEGQIAFNTSSNQFKNLLTSKKIEDRLSFLRAIGITFSIPDNELLLGPYGQQLADAVSSIRLNIENGTIQNFEDLFNKQIVNGPINTLLRIELSNTAEDLSLQYRNPQGQVEYSIVSPSSLSVVINSLKSVDNLSDFILTNPQLGTVQLDGSVTLHAYQQGSQLLKYGGMLFDESGKKRKDINYHLISGIALANEADGEVTSELKRPDKILQELYHILNGTYYTVINSDKSSEFGLDLGHFLNVFDITSSQKFVPEKALSIYQEHLLDEVRTLIELSAGIGDNIQYYSDNQFNEDTGRWMLSHFRDIITSERSNSTLQKAINENNPELFVHDLNTIKEIENYITGFIAAQQKTLIDVGLIKKNNDNSYSTNAISKEQMLKFKGQGLDLDPENFNQVQFDNLSKFIFLNHQISVREQHKILYGHPALYKDLAKRASGITSVKEAIIDDTEVLDWMDVNMPRMDGKLRSATQHQSFKISSYKDVNVVSIQYKEIAEKLYESVYSNTKDKAKAELKIGARFNEDGTIKSLILDKNGNPTGDIKSYLELNEADALSYMMPDFYRDILFLSAKFSDIQNDQWEFELAYERNARSKKSVDHPSYRPYSAQEIAAQIPIKDNQTILAGNPKGIFPVIKPQYFGYQLNSNLQHTTFLKHAAQPKFYRFFEDTVFEHIYTMAQQNQVDLIGFESGQKVGNVYDENKTFTSFYSNGAINKERLPIIQQLYTKFYGIQVEMAAQIKDLVTRGTQMTKILMSNLYRNGKAVNPIYDPLIEAYNETIEKITRLGKENLLDDL